jgi:hypothetical protein
VKSHSNPIELVPPFSGCVGFTFFDHVFGDRNVAQCCFLRRATRWQPNFRRATCHLARGAMTRSGCFCQAGTMTFDDFTGDDFVKKSWRHHPFLLSIR